MDEVDRLPLFRDGFLHFDELEALLGMTLRGLELSERLTGYSPDQEAAKACGGSPEGRSMTRIFFFSR